MPCMSARAWPPVLLEAFRRPALGQTRRPRAKHANTPREQERRELAGRVRARQTGTLAITPLKRWMSPALIERNSQCAAFCRALLSNAAVHKSGSGHMASCFPPVCIPEDKQRSADSPWVCCRDSVAGDPARCCTDHARHHGSTPRRTPRQPGSGPRAPGAARRRARRRGRRARTRPRPRMRPSARAWRRRWPSCAPRARRQRPRAWRRPPRPRSSSRRAQDWLLFLCNNGCLNSVRCLAAAYALEEGAYGGLPVVLACRAGPWASTPALVAVPHSV